MAILGTTTLKPKTSITAPRPSNSIVKKPSNSGTSGLTGVTSSSGIIRSTSPYSTGVTPSTTLVGSSAPLSGGSLVGQQSPFVGNQGYGNVPIVNMGGTYTVGGGSNNNNGSGSGSFGGLSESQLYNEAKEGVEEAKEKQEASKESALGYYDNALQSIANMFPALGDVTNQSLDWLKPILEQMNNFDLDSSKESQLNYFKPIMDQLSGLSGDIISPEQEQQLLANRTSQLTASGQNLASQFGDDSSGIQTGDRLGIARNTAVNAANLPIDLALQVGQTNRNSQLSRLGAMQGVAQNMSGVESENVLRKLGLLNDKANVSGSLAEIQGQGRGDIRDLMNALLSVTQGKAGVQQNYQYDPGLQWVQQLGNAIGQEQGQSGSGSSGGASGSVPTYSAGGADSKELNALVREGYTLEQAREKLKKDREKGSGSSSGSSSSGNSGGSSSGGGSSVGTGGSSSSNDRGGTSMKPLPAPATLTSPPEGVYVQPAGWNYENREPANFTYMGHKYWNRGGQWVREG